MSFVGNRVSSYELVFIISPEVADEEVPNTISNVNESISRIGGTVTETNQWGRRKFAYPIRRFTEGNYVLAHFEMEPLLTKELETNLQRSEEIMRHLLIRLKD